MGLASMHSDGFNAEKASYNRDNRLNQAEFAPGQGGDSSMDDDMFTGSDMDMDIFSDDMSPANTNGMDFGFGGGDGGDGGFGGFNGFNNGFNQQGAVQEKSTEDKFFEGVVAFGKGFSSFTKEFTSSFGKVTPMFWYKWGYSSLKIGIGMVAGGIVLRLFGVKPALDISVGGCLTSAVGSIAYMFSKEDANKCNDLYREGALTSVAEPADTDVGGFDFSGESDFDGFDVGGEGGDEEEYEEYEDEEEEDWGFEESTQEVSTPVDMETALNELTEINKGMYTRQYLWEAFTKVIPNIMPNFSNMRTEPDGSELFLEWNEYLREAAECGGCKQDNLPELEKLQENVFIIKLECTRPVGMKADVVANELASIYAYRCDGSTEEKQGIFAKADTIGKHCIITIFNGKKALISLKDMMDVEKDFFLDTSNVIPAILGVNPLGEVIKCDFKDLESIIVTGMPRSGKSWFVQALLTQMCAFSSPKELIFYICDPKEGVSDFKEFKLPHVKKFVSGDQAIVKELNHIVRVEGARRKSILAAGKCVNIWDYKKKYPDVEIPILYVVIDEVVTLAERMEKEVKQEFQGYLVELISQLPSLGIRAFLIPHVIKNDIIVKTATDLVPCKISIRGDAEHIEKATGSKPKDFPYKLANKGDMAVKLTGFPNTLFVHGAALTKSNPENNAVFDYMCRLWAKLEPDTITDSVAVDKGLDAEHKKILDNIEQELNIDDDDFDIFK